MREEFAEEIDFWSRRFIPAFFFFALMVVYALEPVDSYGISTNSTDGQVSGDDVTRSLPMYQGVCVALRSNPRQCDCPCTVPGELTCLPPNVDSAPEHKVNAWRVGIGLVVSIFAICASLLQKCGPRMKCRIQLARKLDELSWKLSELSSSVSVKAPRRGEQSSHQSSSD